MTLTSCNGSTPECWCAESGVPALVGESSIESLRVKDKTFAFSNIISEYHESLLLLQAVYPSNLVTWNLGGTSTRTLLRGLS